ncbi:Gfo/Idh/MocA family protein [Clostridium sp.]|uniref:Gfo/Idh/MocA family protein n=1 Tax=Clostridium sp. TaxID=1506 RepID=UPI002627404E|nr:Gfo/Idh/MocA family oxidoreductase [uncultured Clostridium sp.]
MKIAMISSWHVHAKDYAKQIMELSQCEIIAVWDENKEAGIKWANKLNCKFIEDYDLLLKDDSIEGVVINSPTVMHTELIIKAANAKKHIFTEKVLALTVDDCIKIKEAVERNNVKFSIAFVHKFSSEMIFAKQMVESGALGDITYARVRNAHNGSIANWLPESFYNKENCGGGAMIDLGTHTVYLLEWLLGKAKNVTATFTKITNRQVEDNAVSVFEFQNGAIGVAETSFVSVYTPLTLEISGTTGTLMIRDGVSYANAETDGKWITKENLPQSLPSPLIQWIEGVTENKEIHIGIDEAISLTRLLSAAYESEETGKKVAIKY